MVINEPRTLTEQEEKIMKNLFERASVEKENPEIAFYTYQEYQRRQSFETLMLFLCIAMLLVVAIGTAAWLHETLGKI